MGLNSGFFTLTSQEPDQWEPETYDEAGMGQDEEVVLIITFKESPLLKNTITPSTLIPLIVIFLLLLISPCKFCMQQKQSKKIVNRNSLSITSAWAPELKRPLWHYMGPQKGIVLAQKALLVTSEVLGIGTFYCGQGPQKAPVPHKNSPRGLIRPKWDPNEHDDYHPTAIC